MPIPGGSLVLLNKKRNETTKPKNEKKPERLRADDKSDDSGGGAGVGGYTSSPSHHPRSGQASPRHSSQSRSGQASPSHHRSTSPRHSLQQNSFSIFGRSPSGQQLASPSRAALASPRRSHQGLQVTNNDYFSPGEPAGSSSSGYVSPKSSPKLPGLRGHSKSASPRRKESS